jgi:glycosyltransferase involved in cell wall biosynthesis
MSLFRKEWKNIRIAISHLMTRTARFSTYSFQRAAQIELVRDSLPEADATLSTSYETVLPNHLYGKGRRFYFAQHFEPLFAGERENYNLAYLDAMTSYHYSDIGIIANSSWLSRKIGEHTGRKIPICLNAIDHELFVMPDKKPQHDGKIVILSYGGRNAIWKGIQDAAASIKKAKEVVPNIEWRVFGDSLLPPQNPIANYTALGYITGDDLHRAYSEADIMLCPSWYESFPLYPLEAMACGTAVISTPFGTEDYLIHLQNGYIVPPRETNLMSSALVQLCNDIRLRSRLSRQGAVDAKQFTWKKSVQQMASLIGIA